MSTATDTKAPKVHHHGDGGTFIELAHAETRDRWGISVTRWTTYRGAVKFEVCRVNPSGTMLRLGLHSTEEGARGQANTEWALDRG